MTEQAIASLIENSLIFGVMFYFVMYFKSRSEVVTDRFMTHLENEVSNTKKSQNAEQ